MPPGSVDVVIVGGVTAAGLMTMLKVFVSLPPEFVALTVKLNVPALFGVPEIPPALFKFKPFGSGWLPLSSDHVIGAAPDALRVWL